MQRNCSSGEDEAAAGRMGAQFEALGHKWLETSNTSKDRHTDVLNTVMPMRMCVARCGDGGGTDRYEYIFWLHLGTPSKTQPRGALICALRCVSRVEQQRPVRHPHSKAEHPDPRLRRRSLVRAPPCALAAIFTSHYRHRAGRMQPGLGALDRLLGARRVQQCCVSHGQGTRERWPLCAVRCALRDCGCYGDVGRDLDRYVHLCSSRIHSTEPSESSVCGLAGLAPRGRLHGATQGCGP